VRRHPIHPALVLLAALAGPAAAQNLAAGFSLQEVERLHLDDAEAGVGGERVVELYLRALTAHGDPVDDLRPAHIDIREDGERIDPGGVSAQPLEKARRGVTWVIALDVSRTMLGGTFDGAKTAAIELLERIGAHDRVAVVTFAQTVEVVARLDDTPNAVRSRLEGLSVDAGGLKTLLFDGLHEAVDLIRSAKVRPRRAAVILFSDGEDTGSDHPLAQAVELARANKVQVYTIGYPRFGGGGLPALQQIARETGADYQQVSSPADLHGFFGAIWDRIARSYLVRFPAAMDGKPHTIKVSVGAQSDTIQLLYPEIAAPVWPWVAGAAAIFALASAVLAVSRLRSAGRLVFVDGPRNGEVHALRRGRLRIGAIDANDIVIPSMSVSRYHAELHVSGRKVEIVDLHSANGTHINGNRVERAALTLRPGDRIRIADVELVYER
jgi:Mg-chelatase subunit ChlD